MDNIFISRLEKEEVESFYELFKSIAKSDFNGWTQESKEKWFLDDYSIDYWRTLLKEDKLPIFVAKDGEDLIGYVMLEGINFGVAYLGWIGVLKSHQNMKIGGKLIEEMINWCKRNNLHKIELETQEIHLQHFYEKHGFVLEGIRKNSWQNLDNYMYGKML